MPKRYSLRVAIGCAVMLAFASGAAWRFTANSASVPGEVNFKKIVLDREFRSEGVAVADVNKDGKPDVLAGNLWYEAPNWTMHEIAPPGKFDAAKGYSNSFVNFAMDVNRDGWPDQIRIGLPFEHKVFWLENPKGKSGHWAEHIVFRNACNESPTMAAGRCRQRPGDGIFLRRCADGLV